MKIKYISFLVAACLLVGTTACDDWLDIDQDTEKKADSMFDNYAGFQGALSGCYSDLAKEDLYGTRLTMADIESLAGLWSIDLNDGPEERKMQCYDLMIHDYTSSRSVSVIKSIYGGLYNTIIEANNLIKGCRESGQNIAFVASRSVVEGEAYAIRAFCHLDVLRLFGQLPHNAVRQISLPYSEITSLEEVPIYYTYQEYIKKLEDDLIKALSLLKDNDPVCDYTFSQLNPLDGDKANLAPIEDDFMTYRHYRMNYWAVKALQARFYMYIGENKKAHDVAMEVINAKTTNGETVVKLSSMSDYGTDKTNFNSSSECLFALYIKKLYDISVPILAGGEVAGTSNVTQIDPKKHLTLTEAWLKDLFKNVNTATDIRFKKMWSNTKTSQNYVFPSIRKHYVYKASASSSGDGVIPMLRLSEMYLIAIETAETVTEANELYTTYMVSKGVAVHNVFSSLADVKNVLIEEFRIEFFAEGQMFYYYKRNNISKMWSKEGIVADESVYVLPVPETEFNPNK